MSAKACEGAGPQHSTDFKIGEYRNQKHIIRGRSITMRGVEVRKCGCQIYPRLQGMLDLLLEKPRKRIVTWSERKEAWS